jgi:predicted alpha-1,2-mannosidase
LFYFIFVAVAISFPIAQGQGPVDLVNPMVGTANGGQTFPGAGVPFGMTQWTPATRNSEKKGVVPYFYDDHLFKGIRGTHFLSGSATQDYGSFQFLAGSGGFQENDEPPATPYTHDEEHATPYLYQVELPKLGVSISATGTARCGILRFVFHRGGKAWLDIQNNAPASDGTLRFDATRQEIVGTNKVRRIYAGNGRLAGFSGYIVVELSRPFKVGGTWTSGRSDFNKASGVGPSGIYLAFNVKPGESVLARVGTSFVSIDEARKNLRAEIPRWKISEVEAASREQWNAALGRIKVKSSERNQRIFYTAMYHALQLPRVMSDIDGTYPRFGGGQSVEKAHGFIYYDDYSAWDTFRAEQPLLTIISPERVPSMIQSLVVKGEEGGFLPIFPAWNSYTSEMDGDHCAAIIGDAYMKGIRGFDVAGAYRLMRKNAFDSPSSDEYRNGEGRRGLATYLTDGYIPLEDRVAWPSGPHPDEQVSRTLDYAYDDFVDGEMASAVGRRSDAAILSRRAKNYRNVIDPETGFARGRYASGQWVLPFDPAKPASYITEGNPFQFTFYVLQDIPGLIQLEHGDAGFIAKLDQLFAQHLYDQGNEPSHHIAYLYDYAGAAFKTQQHIAEIRTEYQDNPGGLPGNDDAGQMSAWYVFSALGFYPVTPGIPRYALGSPLFSDAVIHLPGGKIFQIVVHRDSANAPYIQSAMLNGTPLNRFWLKHSEIIDGGLLVVNMSTHPNKGWPQATEQVN